MAGYSFHSRIKDFAASGKGANQKVAAFFLNHIQDAAFMTVEEIAKQAGVSPGTVSRAAKAMGFTGFPDIQNQIRQVIRINISPQTRMEKAGRGGFNPAASLQLDIENLRILSQAVPADTIREAASLLAKAPAVHVMGTRSSYSAAHFLAFNLGQIRENVVLVEAKTGQLLDEIRRLRKGDLFVSIALPRYSRDTIIMTEEAQKAGCRILAVTDSAFSPIATLAELSLLVACESLSFFNSYVAAFALANTLISQVAVDLKAKGARSLEQLNQLHERYQTFYETSVDVDERG